MSGSRAKAIRRENGGFKKVPKEPTPWYLRTSLMMRKGNGLRPHELAGTPVSEKKREKLTKTWGA